MRIGIVNDSGIAVEALRRSIERGGHAVAWVARDGVQAIDACRADTPDVVLMDLGASTGGPQALVDVLSQMPADLGAAIVIIQHVDKEFAVGLVSWLRERTGFAVEVAAPGRMPEANVALVAATNDHLVMGPGGALSYTPHPRKLPFRPSVDVFFLSAVRYWTRPSVGVVLTGMGRDGAAGLLAMRQARWRTIAQDEATSVVYGMPKAAAELGAAERVLALSRIPRAILDAVSAELSV